MEFASQAPADTHEWGERLKKIDEILSGRTEGGQASVVVVERWRAQVHGASVGDCEAWVLGNGLAPGELSVRHDKRVLGTGMADPHLFIVHHAENCRIIMGTDGLFKYAPKEAIFNVTHEEQPIRRTAAMLAELVRLPNGDRHDDLAIIVCDEIRGRGELERRLQELLPPAREGDAKSQFDVASYYEEIEQQEAAAHWFRAAADSGHTKACTEMGLRFVHGIGVAKDYDLANHYYFLAQNQNDPVAINNLGFHFECGSRGLKKDLQRALWCYRRASRLRYYVALINLGKAYQHGKFGLAVNLKRAAALFRSAARTGSTSGMVRWGNCLEKGLGVPSDPAAAAEQFRKAKVLWNEEGIWRLGLLYELGLGVEENIFIAFEHYAEAAQLGSKEAKRCLGNLYRQGTGVRQDSALARYWLMAAINDGDEVAPQILATMAERS